MNEIRDTVSELTHFRRRVQVISAVVLIAFVVLAARLVYLQVTRHADLAAQAESNRTSVVPIVPSRGLIIDRNSVVLASNYSAHTLEITPSKLDGDVDSTIDALAQIVEITPRDRKQFKRLRENLRIFDSIPIRTRLNDEEVARFAAQHYRFPGVEIKERLLRHYPLGEVASHVIGYIGRINQSEKEAMDDWSDQDQANYRGTEYIGKLSIEQGYEKILHGTTGFEQIETSANGNAVRQLANQSSTPGNTVMLTLDIKLQKLVEDLYGKRRGALVAIEPKTGEVLAFVSKPTFDPNLFVEGIDTETWQSLNESPDKPLLNRALRGIYPPGSTYKPFLALAALQTGKRGPNVFVNDPGYYMFGGHRFGSPDGYLGGVDMRRALELSSDVYFYSLANEMGVNGIHDFMDPLGFGRLTDIDIPGEVRGVLPSIEWKRRVYRQKWYPGETISLGIGQGYNSFTMLQLANATATLANGGFKHRPHLVRALGEEENAELKPVVQPPATDLGFKRGNIAVVRDGMEAVVKTGTARGSFVEAGYQAAGKTGTAQVITLAPRTRYVAHALPEAHRDHALFIAFAPADDPKIAVALIVENAGWGAGAAAPIARRVFDYWLLGQYPSEEDIAAVQAGRATAPIGQPRHVNEIAWPPGAHVGTDAQTDTGESANPSSSEAQP
ncbi:MAG: penicillin-binding protein 2 [Burkholderiaceae bacterium]|nr:penicillin-binding protein 2 [Burkholderiaceae bacterium]